MPTVINVDIDITFLEALSKFKVNYELDDFVVLNVAKQSGSPFRYLKNSEVPSFIVLKYVLSELVT
jgi:hypothetical protein